MQTDFEAMGGMVDFQFLRIFPLKNRCIVFILGKNIPTERKRFLREVLSSEESKRRESL